MPLNPALSRLIAAKLAHARAPRWELPTADVRKAFHDLSTPALTGKPIMVHGFVQMAGIVTDAGSATRQIAEFVNRDA